MHGPCRPRVVLLDFDGTVVDTMEAYAQEAARILEGLGIPRDRVLALYKATAGMAFRDQLRLMGIEGELVEEVARRFEELKKGLLARIKLDVKVLRFVEGVRGLGLQVYLSTNNECNVVTHNKELVAAFDGILCHDPRRGIRKGKDHVDILRGRLGVRECEIVFIGDSDYDINLYKELGVQVLRTRGLWVDGDQLLMKIKLSVS